MLGDDLDTLAPYERGGMTRAEMARELGISVQWLRKLMARERKRAAQEAGEKDLPWAEITSGAAEGYHYNLSNDKYSLLPSGPFRIGTSGGGTQVVRSDDDRTRVRGEKPKPAAKFRPKKPRKQR